MKKNDDISPIHLRNTPPPWEMFDHIGFFKFMFSWIKPENYLELGVRSGACFRSNSRLCKKAIGVDIISPAFKLEENMEYYTMTTDEYFSQLDDDIQFDVVFIDADHSHEQSLKDFMNVKDRVIEDGLIFFHDSYPYSSSMIHPGWCGEVYKTVLFIKQNLIDDFEVVTLPIHPGVTIVKKISRKKQLIYEV